MEDNESIGYIFLIGMPKTREEDGEIYYYLQAETNKPWPFRLVDEKNRIYVCRWDISMFVDPSVYFRVFKGEKEFRPSLYEKFIFFLCGRHCVKRI